MQSRRLSTKDRVLTLAIGLVMLAIVACGGSKSIGIPGIPGTGGAAAFAKRLFSGPHSGAIGFSNATASANVPFQAGLATEAAAATISVPAQYQQGYDAQCDYSANPGFLGTVPAGSFVPLNLPGTLGACNTFSSPAVPNSGKGTITDGTLNGLVVQITTRTNAQIQCRDLNGTLPILDQSKLQIDVAPNGDTLGITGFITAPDGTTITQITGFTCVPALTVEPADVKTIEVNLSKN